MNAKIFLLLLGSYMLSCSKSPVASDRREAYFVNQFPGKQDSILRIVTYNLHLGFTRGNDPYNKKHRVTTVQYIKELCNIFREAGAEVIALQEVPLNRCNNTVKDLMKALADSLEMNIAFAEHGSNDACFPGNGSWGVGILTKFAISSIDAQEVYNTGVGKTRIALRATVVMGDSSLVNVFNVHLPGSGRQEVESTMDFIRKASGPVVLVGDFNRAFGDPDLSPIVLNDLTGPEMGGIDRIFANDNVQLLEKGDVQDSHLISDHRAVYGVLKIRR